MEKPGNHIQPANAEELRIPIFAESDRRDPDRLKKIILRFFEEAEKIEGVSKEIVSDLKFITADYLENLPNRFDSN